MCVYIFFLLLTFPHSSSLIYHVYLYFEVCMLVLILILILSAAAQQERRGELAAGGGGQSAATTGGREGNTNQLQKTNRTDRTTENKR